MFGFSFGFLSCCGKNKNPAANNASKDADLDESRTSSDIQLLNIKKRVSARSKLSHGFNSYYDKGFSIVSGHSSLTPIPEAYPKNEVIIIGRHHKIVAKIVQRKISESLQPVQAGLGISKLGTLSGGSNPIDVSLGLTDGSSLTGERLSENSIRENFPKERKRERISQEKQDVKVERLTSRVPENVARHIAYRLKCDTIIDVLCEYGENAIQFAKFCNMVIAICPTIKNAISSSQNSQIYKMEHKIDFIAGDFLSTKNLVGNVVFLNPSFEKSDQEEDGENKNMGLSLLKSMKQNLPQLIAKSLHISSKVAMRLPGWAKINEIADLFHLAIREYGRPMKRFSIEIEEILNTNEDKEHILVLFGDCSSIDLKEEYGAIFEHILNTESPLVRLRYSLPVIGAILDKIGVHKALQYINEVSDKKNLDQPLLRAFVNKLIKEGVFTQQSLDKLIEEELRNRSGSLETRPSIDRRDSEFPNLLEKYTIKPVQGQNNFTYKSESAGIPPSRSKESKVVSELAVSSYSVSSNYLYDSETEETIDAKIGSTMSLGRFGHSDENNRVKITIPKEKENKLEI